MKVFLKKIYFSRVQKLKALIESDFDPDKSCQYELADIKVCFNQLLLKVQEFLWNYSDIECTAIHNSAASLQSVCRMFQKLIRFELGDSLIQIEAKAQSTPQRYKKVNQTFTSIFPDGRFNRTYDFPRDNTFTIGNTRTGNETFDISTHQPRNQTFVVPEIVVGGETRHDATFDISRKNQPILIEFFFIFFYSQRPVNCLKRLEN